MRLVALFLIAAWYATAKAMQQPGGEDDDVQVRCLSCQHTSTAKRRNGVSKTVGAKHYAIEPCKHCNRMVAMVTEPIETAA